MPKVKSLCLRSSLNHPRCDRYDIQFHFFLFSISVESAGEAVNTTFYFLPSPQSGTLVRSVVREAMDDGSPKYILNTRRVLPLPESWPPPLSSGCTPTPQMERENGKAYLPHTIM